MTHALASRVLALTSVAAVMLGCTALGASKRAATAATAATAAGVLAGGQLERRSRIPGVHLEGTAHARRELAQRRYMTGVPGTVAPPDLVEGLPARVIVLQAAQDDARPAELVGRLGGRVTRRLPIVDGFAATLPARAVPALAGSPGVAGVVPDQRVLVAGGLDGSVARAAAGAAAAAQAPPAGLTATDRDVVGASRINAGGNTGTGVTVAMVDTGVAEVGDLAGRMVVVRDGIGGLLGRSAKCKNLSGEAGCGDGYGHGTFIAGLIAGNGRASSGRLRGVAPGARLLSVKIAGRDGSSDASTLLAAIQWIVSHRKTYGIDVLNLSLGTDSGESYHVDPLNIAVQRAWQAGIVVVTAASNRGPGSRTISKPGDDPYVITVGAIDDRGTAPIRDDTIPDFSARGPTAADGLAKPDLVAPGTDVASLNAAGSLVNRRFPTTGAYRRGTGTSMATAMVSGLAALARAAHPTATPDRVKFMLTETARPVAGADRLSVGAGVVDGWRALTAAPQGLANRDLVALAARDRAPRRSAGLDGSRGSVRTRTTGPIRMVLTGAQTTTLQAWEPASLVAPWTEQTWRQTVWQLKKILPTQWSGTSWSGRNWQWHAGPAGRQPARRLYGRSLPGSTWYGVWG